MSENIRVPTIEDINRLLNENNKSPVISNRERLMSESKERSQSNNDIRR